MSSLRVRRSIAVRITLRPAQLADRELLIRVYGSSREIELEQVPWTPEQKNAFIRQQFAAQDAHYHANYEGATYDVIEVDGEPAGRLYVARWPEEIRLMDIAVLPKYRNRGIGARLLRDLQDEVRSAGKRLSVHVEKLNPARALYERLGFEIAERLDVYDRMEWRPAAPDG